MEIWR